MADRMRWLRAKRIAITCHGDACGQVMASSRAHAVATPPGIAQTRLISCGVDREVRSRENPSDHAPVWIELAGAD